MSVHRDLIKSTCEFAIKYIPEFGLCVVYAETGKLVPDVVAFHLSRKAGQAAKLLIEFRALEIDVVIGEAEVQVIRGNGGN